MTTKTATRTVYRVFQEPTGRWHYCVPVGGWLDARGTSFDSRAEATRAVCEYEQEEAQREDRPPFTIVGGSRWAASKYGVPVR